MVIFHDKNSLRHIEGSFLGYQSRIGEELRTFLWIGNPNRRKRTLIEQPAVEAPILITDM